jgi:hypothetical protein
MCSSYWNSELTEESTKLYYAEFENKQVLWVLRRTPYFIQLDQFRCTSDYRKNPRRCGSIVHTVKKKKKTDCLSLNLIHVRKIAFLRSRTLANAMLWKVNSNSPVISMPRCSLTSSQQLQLSRSFATVSLNTQTLTASVWGKAVKELNKHYAMAFLPQRI